MSRCFHRRSRGVLKRQILVKRPNPQASFDVERKCVAPERRAENRQPASRFKFSLRRLSFRFAHS
ncbi:hypothetical protein R0J89_20060, partial [Psychrobacter sp. SIMBA_152]